jgi:hypothetical protein
MYAHRFASRCLITVLALSLFLPATTCRAGEAAEFLTAIRQELQQLQKQLEDRDRELTALKGKMAALEQELKKVKNGTGSKEDSRGRTVPAAATELKSETDGLRGTVRQCEIGAGVVSLSPPKGVTFESGELVKLTTDKDGTLVGTFRVIDVGPARLLLLKTKRDGGLDGLRSGQELNVVPLSR